MLAEIAQSAVTDGHNGPLLCAGAFGAYEDAKVDHLGWCVWRLERRESLGRRAPAKVDQVSARKAVGSKDLFEDGRSCTSAFHDASASRSAWHSSARSTSAETQDNGGRLLAMGSVLARVASF